MLRRREMLGLLVDWGYRADGIPVRLFGAWTTLPAGPATLAAKTGSRILPIAIHRQPDDTFDVSLADRHRGRLVRPRRAPAGDPGHRRRPARQHRRGAGPVVQLQADLAGDPAEAADLERRADAHAGRHRRPRSGDGRSAAWIAVAALVTARAVAAVRGRLLIARLVAGLPPARGAARAPGRARRRPLVPGDARPGGPGPAEPAAGSADGPGRRRSRLRDRGPSRRQRPARPRAPRPASVPARRPLLPRGRAARRPSAGASIVGADGHRDARRSSPRRSRRVDAVIFVGLHFGSLELPALLPRAAGRRGGRRRWRRSTTRTCRPGSSGPRGAVGIRIVGLREARRELLAALRAGTSVGLVGDRDLTGGGTADRRSSARRRRLPLGPALLAIETGAPAVRHGVRRTTPGRYLGTPRAASTCRPTASRRERVTATTAVDRRGLRARHRGRARAVVGGLLPDLAGPRGRRASARGRRSRRARRPREPAATREPPIPSATAARSAEVGGPTCTSTPSPRTAPPTSCRSSSTSRAAATSTSSPSPTTSASTPRWPARAMARDRGLPLEVIVGEEVTTLGGHLLALFIERPHPALPLAALDDRRRPRRGRPGRSRPIPSCPTRCAPRAGCCGGCSTTPTRPSVPTRSRRSTRRRSGGRGTIGSCASPTTTAWPRSATAMPTPSRRSASAGRPSRAAAARDLRRGHRGRGTTDHGGAFHGTAGQVGVFGQQLRKRAVDARDEVAGPRPARRHRPRPRLSRRPRPAPALRTAGPARRGRAVKIGLVCPYIYPASGGVAQHVRFLYENLRQRGHDVRILTASHGPQRASEGDIIRLGVGFSVPINASVGTLTFSPRYLTQIGDDARARAVRRPPLPRAVRAVPVALPAARVDERQRRDVPRLRRLLAVVRVRQPGAAAATRLGCTAGSPSAPRRATSSTATSRATTRSSPTASTSRRFANAVPIARWQDGTPNVLFVGRHEPRKGLLDLLKAHRILRKTGSDPRLLVVGSGPQEREARRYVATRGLKGVEFLGRVSDAEKAQLFRTADVYASPATGGESFGIVLLEAMAAGTPIVASDIHGYKGVVRRGREGLLVPPREPRELADGHRPPAARPRAARADGRRGPRRAPRSSAGRGSRPRSTTTTASSSAAWPPAGTLPAGFHGGRSLRRPRRSGPGRPPQSRRGRAAPPDGRRPSRLARLRERQPPDRGRVGDHEAGQAEGDRQRDQGRAEAAASRGRGPRCSTGNWKAYR